MKRVRSFQYQEERTSSDLATMGAELSTCTCHSAVWRTWGLQCQGRVGMVCLFVCALAGKDTPCVGG